VSTSETTVAGAGAAAPTPHPSLAAVFAELDRRGVAWCVLRDADELDAPHGDVDLLVGAADAEIVSTVVRERGFVPSRAWGRGSHRAFVSYSSTDASWLKLDVVTRLDFGRFSEYPTELAAQVLARRRPLGPVTVPDPADEFWLLWLHCLLDKSEMPPRHADSLRRLASSARPDGPVAASVASSLPTRDLDGIVLAAARGHGADVTAAELTSSWRQRRPARTGLVVHRNRWLRRLARAGVPPRRGVTVALLAPDGAGKSTAVARLRGSLPIQVRDIYMGLYPRGQRRVGPAVPGLGVLVRLSRQWRGYLLGRHHRRTGRVVIFDRYCYDARLQAGGSLLRRSRRWLLGHACPPPDLTLVLDAPGALLHRRKAEHPPEELEHRRQGYLDLARRFGWHIVDASRSADEVEAELTQQIWRIYRARAS
jgi:thymidylate kinase